MKRANKYLPKLQVRHWADAIAREIIKSKSSPFVAAAAITTSGPSHIGTVCEFLYPSAIVKYLRDGDYKTEFIFIGDLMDAFDRIPGPLRKYNDLKYHLGKPLCNVPDPYDCCESYGKHFLSEVTDLMDKLEVSCSILGTNELVESGRYDRYARIFYKEKQRVQEIARKTAELSGTKSLPDWVDIVMPICENCGKIATTKVEYFDGNHIYYSDSKDVGYIRGCGYKGERKLEEHQYKLFWRLDWPSRQDFLNVTVELAGIDHHTRGGSWDTAVDIHREIFGKEPPVGKRYGFVLLHGKKYSKSEGVGLSIQELLNLVPPPLIKYKLFRADIRENKEFDPSGHSLIRLYNEFKEAADLYEQGKTFQRGKNKMALAYSLSTRIRPWRLDFTDLLINYQIYRDWVKVAKRIGDEKGVGYLKNYVENWIEKKYLPEEFVFRFKPKRINILNEEVVTFAEKLDCSMDAEDVHNLVYAVAKEKKVKVPLLFKALYLSLISKDYGPRFGNLVSALGIPKVRNAILKIYGLKV